VGFDRPFRLLPHRTGRDAQATCDVRDQVLPTQNSSIIFAQQEQSLQSSSNQFLPRNIRIGLILTGLCACIWIARPAARGLSLPPSRLRRRDEMLAEDQSGHMTLPHPEQPGESREKFVMTLESWRQGSWAFCQHDPRATLKRFKESGELYDLASRFPRSLFYVRSSRGPIGFTTRPMSIIGTTISTDIAQKSTINYVPVSPQNELLLRRNSRSSWMCSLPTLWIVNRQLAFSCQHLQAGVMMVVPLEIAA